MLYVSVLDTMDFAAKLMVALMTHCIMKEYNTVRHECQYLIKLVRSVLGLVRKKVGAGYNTGSILENRVSDFGKLLGIHSGGKLL